MNTASTPEKSLKKAVLFIGINAELKEALGKAADHKGLPLNEFLATHLARLVKRPDLAAIPRKKMGRPRKSLAI